MCARMCLRWICLVMAAGAGANPVPDPNDCTVLPLDEQAEPRILGIPSDSGAPAAALIDVWIIGYSGYPWVNGHVQLEFPGGAEGLCICEGAILSGYTDEEGHVQLKVLLGGCLEGPDVAEIVLDGGVRIRSVDSVVSPDWSGQECDGEIGLADFTLFSSGYTSAAQGCSDFTGDGRTSLEDFIIFGSAWGRSCDRRDGMPRAGAYQPLSN